VRGVRVWAFRTVQIARQLTSSQDDIIVFGIGLERLVEGRRLGRRADRMCCISRSVGNASLFPDQDALPDKRHYQRESEGDETELCAWPVGERMLQDTRRLHTVDKKASERTDGSRKTAF